MSFLSDIHTYWGANTALTALIPASQVYTGLVPETIVTPYAVILSLNSTPNWSVGKPYWESFSFQISIFADSCSQAESIAQTVMDQFDYVKLNANTISCERTNYQLIVEYRGVYHAVVEYTLNENKARP